MQKSEKEKLVARLRRAADAQRRAYSGNLYHEGIAQGLDDAAGILGKVRCEDVAHWIPCTVRMPESGSYLVTKKQATGEVQVAIGNYYASGNQWSGNGNFKNVIAWMPLPKPWKGEEP